VCEIDVAHSDEGFLKDHGKMSAKIRIQNACGGASR
jgi:hypothetical protein